MSISTHSSIFLKNPLHSFLRNTHQSICAWEPSIHPSIQYLHPFTHPSILEMHPSIYFKKHPSVNLLIRPSIHHLMPPSIYPFIHSWETSIHPSIYLNRSPLEKCPSSISFIHESISHPSQSIHPASPLSIDPFNAIIHLTTYAFMRKVLPSI